jgi:hypothetical protein
MLITLSRLVHQQQALINKDSFTSYIQLFSSIIWVVDLLPWLMRLRAKWQLHWSRRSTRAAAVPKNIPEPPQRCWCPSLCNTCLGVVVNKLQGSGGCKLQLGTENWRMAKD